MICYLITAGVVALGLLATWTSGRDAANRHRLKKDPCTLAGGRPTVKQSRSP